jgi:hypothetical protein
MWILTDFGFFSVVKKHGEQELTVRSRVREDLELLRERYLPDLGPVLEGAGSDYPYRARASAAAVAAAISKAVTDIDYGNFKDSVEIRQGHARGAVYSKVWAALMKLEADTVP